jgi:small subunit ribosomal protein S27Ae
MPKEIRKREKKIRKGRKHETVKIQDVYRIEGDTLVRKKKWCPRCGPGTTLAKHNNREYCGKCGYTVMQKA